MAKTMMVQECKGEETPRDPGTWENLLHCTKTAWLFVESDFATFVIPNCSFGIFGVLSGVCVYGQASFEWADILRFARMAFFNFYMLLVFDLANQRLPKSVVEDQINKPWRPIPTQRITAEKTRRAMLCIIPLTMVLNYAFGVWTEGALILILTWLYNDLEGGDEVVRNPIIAIAFGCFNKGSLEIASGANATMSKDGYAWILLISLVIASTMQVQDLKDQEGDQIRGRKTIPLALGDRFCRWSIFVFVPFWTLAAVLFWRLGFWTSLPSLMLGAWVSFRSIQPREKSRDARTWRLWCLWSVFLYALPLSHKIQQEIRLL